MNSIVTKRGDDGWTDMLFGGRARKDSLLIAAIGDLDELNAWIGYFSPKITAEADGWPAGYETIQKTLVSVMGELSASNKEKYLTQFKPISKLETENLEKNILAHEEDALRRGIKYQDWATPSSMPDLLCRITRRCERSILALHFYQIDEEKQSGVREEIRLYINRLSDYFWLHGRK